MIGGAGAKGCEAADYLCEASACEGQELGGGGGGGGGAKAPLTPLVLPTLIPTANLPPRNSLPNVLGLFPKCGKNNEIVRPIIVTYHFPYNQNLFFLLESGVWARD